MDAAQDGHWLMRLAVRPGLEDELLARVALDGLGSGAAQRHFPRGLLADESEPPLAEVEVRLWIPAQQRVRCAAWLAELRAAWSGAGDALRLLGEEPVVLDADPATAWRAHWRPFRCAGFAVRADFHDPATLPRKPGDLPLVLLAGSAFGSGGHASTRLALAAVRRASELRAPARWLDVGTGSGILAVAAVLLGARSAAGMDPDRHSPPQALAMAERNGVGGRVAAWRGTLASAAGRWPAIAANLFADLLQDEAQAFAGLLEPEGLLCAGGVVDRSWPATRAALTGAGLRLLEVRARGRWIASLWERLP